MEESTVVQQWFSLLLRPYLAWLELPSHPLPMTGGSSVPIMGAHEGADSKNISHTFRRITTEHHSSATPRGREYASRVHQE